MWLMLNNGIFYQDKSMHHDILPSQILCYCRDLVEISCSIKLSTREPLLSFHCAIVIVVKVLDGGDGCQWSIAIKCTLGIPSFNVYCTFLITTP